ncbi:MAG TPA: ABC transporter permease, partial [Solirubrobacterales bacterium]|nr:ABC transporter permease [Solirubrobacterales bacterium]
MSTDALVHPGEPAPGDLGVGSELPRAGGARLSLWVLRRVALSLLTLLGVSIVVFAATQAIPGDPAREILGHVTPAQLAAFNQEHGLDRPLLTQYFDWLGNAVTGSFGSSIATHEDVLTVIGRRGLNTLALVLFSALISIPISLLIGTISAVRRDRPVDHGIQTVLLTLTAMPEFVIALLLLV